MQRPGTYCVYQHNPDFLHTSPLNIPLIFGICLIGNVVALKLNLTKGTVLGMRGKSVVKIS